MSVQLKITFTSGGNLGEEFQLDLSEPRLLGRTHTADVVVSKTDGDVSGRHLEFRAEGDRAVASCLSHHGFLLNGQPVGEGEARPLKSGDEIRLGKRVRLRVDGAGFPGAAAETPERETFATRAGTFATAATGVTGTFATRPFDATFATRAATDSSSFGASVVETPIGDAASLASTRLPQQSSASQDAVTVQEATTGGAAGSTVPYSDAPSTSGYSTGGETIGMVTLPGNMDVIRAISAEKERARRFKLRLLTVASFGVLALFGALVYWRWPRAERWLRHPQPIVQHFVKNSSGATRLFVDFPKNARTRLSERANGGVDVETLTGKARDVPMRLSLDVRIDATELGLSLEASAERELAALQKQGYSFEPTGVDRGFAFFEYDYPLSCENGGTGRGVRFCRREFTRSDGSGQWHGVLVYFRDASTAYRLLREIPEPEWARGQSLLCEDPNLALCAGFLIGQWESPGASAVAGHAGRPAADLLKEVDAALERNLPSEWRETGHKIDALVLAGLKGDADVLAEGRKRLERFRTLKDLFYDECRARRDMGEPNEAFAKCWGAFGNDAGDLRSRRLSDPKEWRRK